MRLYSFIKNQKFGLSSIRKFSNDAAFNEAKEKRFKIKRGNYGLLNDKHIAKFESIVGSSHLVQDDLTSYNVDFLRSVKGNSKLVLKPGTVEEISAILKYCNEHKLAVCPQGGNTGLVGGSVPVFDELVLSMQRLNKVLSIDEITGITICEAGCVLENLDAAARDKGLIIPLDLGAKGTCHIGGNVATNAGGLRVIRYGNLHGSVLGVETVLANGDVLDLLSNFKKDNTGYHLKHMFIGSEGTLGIVTKVALLCPTVPSSVHVAFVGLNCFDDVLKNFLNAKNELGEILSSVEMIDAVSLDASMSHFNLRCPIGDFPFYMLLEVSGSNEQHDLEKFEAFLNKGMDNEIIRDGYLTGETGSMQNIWKLREYVPMGLAKDGYCFKYDISLPLREFYKIVQVMQDKVGDKAKRVCGYGHLGDSNLHLNIACPEYNEEVHKIIEPFVYEYTAQVKGSVSAEHGIGFLKTKYLPYSKSAAAIAMMRAVKQQLDPNGILNPYKVLA